jgi:hypothetical protein
VHVQLATLRGARDDASDGRPGERRPRQLPIHPHIMQMRSAGRQASNLEHGVRIGVT